MTETVAVAADHGGYDLKTILLPELQKLGFAVLDLGTQGPESVDYPTYANALAAALAAGRAQRGVLICGTGIGMSIAANRHRHLRCALCHDGVTARLSRQHNDANVLALGGRVLGSEVARDILRIFFTTEFDGGGRHSRRVAMLA
jgi:ribose 5-phosphate isomerase B